MTNEVKTENNQMENKMVKLENDNVNFLVPAVEYDVTKDSRMLIPFVKDQKIGFVNRNSEIVVEAKYDAYVGDARDEKGCIKVGVRHQEISQDFDGEINVGGCFRWGVIDAFGNVLIEPEYKSISISSDNGLFTLNSSKVVNRLGEVIVSEDEFCLAENIFDYLPDDDCDDDDCDDDDWDDDDWDDDGWDEVPHYGKYAGSYAQDVMGFSDDVIDDAFDGDPDAYWNID